MARPEDFDLGWTWVSPRPVDIFKPFQLQISVSVKQGFDLSDCLLLLDYSPHFEPMRTYVNDKNSVIITLKPLESSSVRTLKDIEIILMKSNSKLATLPIAWNLADFTGIFYPQEADGCANILLFGLMGSAKSSFVNSSFTLLRTRSNQIVSDIALSGGSTNHVTKQFNSYRLLDYDTRKLTPFRLWDTWGLVRDNYSEFQFEKMLQGHIPNGFQMQNKNDDLNIAQSHSEDKKIHCVIFFIPIGEVVLSTSELLTKTKQYIEKAIAQEVSVIIALTKVDSICPQFRSDTTKIPPEIQKNIVSLGESLNISTQKIIPLVNYTRETGKTLNVDRSVYLTLQAAARGAAGVKMREEIRRRMN